MEETKTLKKKKPYVKPEMHVEEFTPDQLVCNTCFQVVCDVNGKDDIQCQYQSGVGYTDITHGRGGCGNPENQYLTELSNGTWTVKEINSDQGNGLSTVFTPISAPSDYTKDKSLDWNTKNTDGRVWHHHGHVIIDKTVNHS